MVASFIVMGFPALRTCVRDVSSRGRDISVTRAEHGVSVVVSVSIISTAKACHPIPGCWQDLESCFQTTVHNPHGYKVSLESYNLSFKMKQNRNTCRSLLV